jgi:ribose transport system substrate-binding protein
VNTAVATSPLIYDVILVVVLGGISLSGGHYFKDLSGKTIAFVPVTMGVDLTEGWASVIKQQADRLGMKLEIRDPHFSADAGAQAITSLIAEKPNVLVVHNPDIQSYAKLLKRAEEAGIHVIQINMRSNYNSDVYVGADWIGIGEAEAQASSISATPARAGRWPFCRLSRLPGRTVG